MRRFGLIGYPLSHSFSPAYFNAKFKTEHIADASYELFELSSVDLFPGLLKTIHGLAGLNVTIPYKTSVVPFLDEMDVISQQVGAVNTIKINNGYCKGYNTDVTGFRKSLLNLIGNNRPGALLLGTGGSAKAVCYVLHQLNISFKQVSRNAANNILCYDDVTADLLSQHLLIINCTPLGKSPDVSSKPVLPYHALTQQHLLFDLNYNPDITAFLRAGVEQGCRTKNGYEMLTLQAEAAWEIWNS